MALEVMENADELVAHSLLGFDLPALKKVYPGWSPRGKVRDSLVVAQTIWPREHLKDLDSTNIRRKRAFPKNLVGRHSLKAWGYRLKDLKGESPSSWAHLTPEMLRYCQQDVQVLALLWKRIQDNAPTEAQIELEQAFYLIVEAQVARGFRMDLLAVTALITALTARRAALNDALSAAFPAFSDEYTTPKKMLKRTRVVPFNPNSRAHIARALTEKYDWRPRQFTETGLPQVDEAVIGALDYPEAKLILERLMLKTRLGQIAEGKSAWFKLVNDDGRVYGKMAHNSTITSRCSHSKPNLSAVPKMDKPWGLECRRCWVASPGHKLVIADATGIDARMIAHYSARFDNGEFARLLLGGDIHTRNAGLLGCSRDQAKGAFYAILYGAQGPKVGKILKVGPAVGKTKRDALLASLPGLGKLIRAVEIDAKARGWLRTLDGRRVWVRRTNAALNTLAQAAAAIVMKQAIVLASAWTAAYQVAFVHDEIVLDVPVSLAEQSAAALVEAIKAAGVHFKLRIPLDAHSAIGDDWSAKA